MPIPSLSRLHTAPRRSFDFLDPCAQDVRIEDIANALSNTCRYNGHVPRFYSVAQHAVLVADLVHRASRNALWALVALHHDSAEAYLGDIPRPLKRYMEIDGRPFDDVEARVWHVVLEGLGITPDPDSFDLIKEADDAVLDAEKYGFEVTGIFKPHPHFTWLDPVYPEDCLGPHHACLAFERSHEMYYAAALAQTSAVGVV